MPRIQNVIDEETELKLLRKHTGTERLYDIQLDADQLQASDTISSVTSLTPVNLGKVSGSTNITVTGTTHDSAQTIQATIGAGTSGEKYRLDYIVVMTSGDTISGSVIMEVF